MTPLRLTTTFVASLSFIIALLASGMTQAQPPAIPLDLKVLSSTVWLTTKVYVEGAPEKDVKADYMGVVGLSQWDTDRNRYEFFDPITRASKLKTGGGGYFFVTGDQKEHVLVPDTGAVRVLPRRLEKLTAAEFTYSREVPEKMVPGNPPVRIYVVHTPYVGPAIQP